MKRGGPLKRKTPLRSVSAKRSKIQRQRRTLVQTELERRPICEAAEKIENVDTSHKCSVNAVDIHEPLTRARGGSIVDVNNTMAVCRSCHDWIHDHPETGHVIGLLRHSWDQ